MEPDTSSSRLRAITASKILAKIERGQPVEYEGVIVEGDLDLSELDLPTEHVERTASDIKLGLAEEAKQVMSPINITNSKIQGTVNLGNAIFQESVIFKDTNFSGYTNYKGAQFSDDANFGKAEFSGDADFGGAKFSDGANFGGAKFSGYAYFESAQFSGGADFVGAQFGRVAYFRDVSFSGYAYFTRAQFGCVANFREAKFSGDANFWVAKFSGDANFGKAEFSGDADFGRAEFGGDADFLRAQCSKKLILNGLKFDRLYITWNSIRDNLAYDGPAYLALIRNFKIIEQFSDADDCYYQYRKESQARKKWYSEENRLIEYLVRCYDWTSANIKRISEYLSWLNAYPPLTWIHRFNWSKLLDCIGSVSCGYGVRIGPIILWAFGSVLGFTFLYKLLPKSYGGIIESGPSTVTMGALNNSTLLLTFGSGDCAVSIL